MIPKDYEMFKFFWEGEYTFDDPLVNWVEYLEKTALRVIGNSFEKQSGTFEELSKSAQKQAYSRVEGINNLNMSKKEMTEKIVLTWISEKDERLKYVLMGKSPKTIKAAFEFLNLWSEVCNQEVPVNLRSRGYINGKCAWAEFFGRRHGVTGASVLNVVEAVLKKLGMTLEDVIKDDWK